MQYFRGDELEHKIVDATNYLFDALNLSIDEFELKAYEIQPLGEIIHDNAFSPLVNAIKKAVFVQTFKEIFEAFEFAGTFETYINVFKKIFGEETTITFTRVAPAHLGIAIGAENVTSLNALYREIFNNAYVYDDLLDHTDDNILFRAYAGIQSQTELEQVLYFFKPNGIFTEITLTIA